MFCRLRSGLPEDPSYPEDLKKLGYFVNDKDEIRNIKDPKYYFKFHISKNERYNERQRFAMNTALERLVHSRLEALGLEKVRLPVGAGPTDPHVPIFVSPDLESKTRIILVVGEASQDLGVLAHRVVGGPGGVAHGSMESVVRLALKQKSSENDAPGIVIANPGQLFWWAKGRRSLSLSMRHAAPRASAVSFGPWHDPAEHSVPGHRNPAEHVASVFSNVLAPAMGRGGCRARLSIIGVDDGADAVAEFLNVEDNSAVWCNKLECFAAVGGQFRLKDVANPLLRQFWMTRTRVYVMSSEKAGTPIEGPKGSTENDMVQHYGCPIFSAGVTWPAELMFVEAKKHVLDWVHIVALNKDYINPGFGIPYVDEEDIEPAVCKSVIGGECGLADDKPIGLDSKPIDHDQSGDEVNDGTADGNECQDDCEIGCEKQIAADTIELESGNAPHGVTITLTDVDLEDQE